MKIVKYLFFLILMAVIGIAIYAAIQPSDFEITRTRVIKAPASIIFNNINDYKNWHAWNPWKEEDPSMTFSYPEITTGVGSSYSWDSKEGKGKMETIAQEINTSLKQKLSFKPFESFDVNWDLENIENGTKVTWAMKGKKDFMFKVFLLFMGSMEKTVGPMYERGLEKLDSVVIESTKKYSVKIEGITKHGGGFYIYNTTSSKITEVESKMQEILPKIGVYATQNNITVAGAPFTYYREWDEENNATIFSCALPTTEKVITNTNSGILTGYLEPFTAVKTTLKGNYSNLKEAWEIAKNHIKDQNLEEEGPVLEVYLTDPGNHVNPADWVTEIYIGIKSE